MRRQHRAAGDTCVVGSTLLACCSRAVHASHGAVVGYLHSADVAILIADGAALGEHVEVLERQQDLEPGIGAIRDAARDATAASSQACDQ